MKNFRFLFISFLLLLCGSGVAQTTNPVGYANTQLGVYDSIDLSSLYLGFQAPVLQKSGSTRLPFNYSIVGFPNVMPGMWGQTSVNLGIPLYPFGGISFSATPVICGTGSNQIYVAAYNTFGFVDGTGQYNTFNQLTGGSSQLACQNTSDSFRTADGSLSLTASVNSSYQMFYTVTDGQGNIIINNARGGGFLTAGWTASTNEGLSAFLYDSNGNEQMTTACASNVCTSGTSAPTFNATVGGTTTDGDLTWTNLGPPAAQLKDTNGNTVSVAITNLTGTTQPGGGSYADASRNYTLSQVWTYTDAMGLNPLTVTYPPLQTSAGSLNSTVQTTMAYTDASGTGRDIYLNESYLSLTPPSATTPPTGPVILGVNSTIDGAGLIHGNSFSNPTPYPYFPTSIAYPDGSAIGLAYEQVPSAGAVGENTIGSVGVANDIATVNITNPGVLTTASRITNIAITGTYPSGIITFTISGTNPWQVGQTAVVHWMSPANIDWDGFSFTVSGVTTNTVTSAISGSNGSFSESQGWLMAPVGVLSFSGLTHATFLNGVTPSTVSFGGQPQYISSATATSSSVATYYYTPTNYQAKVGDVIDISGFSDNEFDGSRVIVASVGTGTVTCQITPCPIYTFFTVNGTYESGYTSYSGYAIVDSQNGTTPFIQFQFLHANYTTTADTGYVHNAGPASTTTGRLAQITLPTGGTIKYAYSGGQNNSGINTDGSYATITRTTSDGTTTFTHTPAPPAVSTGLPVLYGSQGQNESGQSFATYTPSGLLVATGQVDIGGPGCGDLCYFFFPVTQATLTNLVITGSSGSYYATGTFTGGSSWIAVGNDVFVNDSAISELTNGVGFIVISSITSNTFYGYCYGCNGTYSGAASGPITSGAANGGYSGPYGLSGPPGILWGSIITESNGASSVASNTTVVDPAGNTSVYTFAGFRQVDQKVYQGAVPTNQLLNSNFASGTLSNWTTTGSVIDFTGTFTCDIPLGGDNFQTCPAVFDFADQGGGHAVWGTTSIGVAGVDIRDDPASACTGSEPWFCQSDWLYMTGFNSLFSPTIPTPNTITGIEFETGMSFITTFPWSFQAQLLINGAPVGNVKLCNATYTNDTCTFGSSTDTWGTQYPVANATTAQAITTTGVQQVQLASGATIASGDVVLVDTGANQEQVTITFAAPTSGAYKATFTKTHATNVAVTPGSASTTQAITTTGAQWVDLNQNDAALHVNSSATIDNGPNRETDTVLALAPTMTANFTKTHASGVGVVNAPSIPLQVNSTFGFNLEAYTNGDGSNTIGICCSSSSGPGFPNFTVTVTGNTPGAWTISSATAPSGDTYSATVSSDAQTKLMYVNNAGSQYLAVNPGDEIQYGGALLRSGGTGNMWWTCAFYTSTDTFISQCPNLGPVKQASSNPPGFPSMYFGPSFQPLTWTHYSGIAFAPSNAAYVVLYAEVHGQGDTDTSFTSVFVDDASLVDLTSVGLLQETVTCYNQPFLGGSGNSTAPCVNPATFIPESSPVTEADVYTFTPGVTAGPSAITASYDSYGRKTSTALYDYGHTTVSAKRTYVYGTYAGSLTTSASASNCSALANTAVIAPVCMTTLTDSSGTVWDEAVYQYDVNGNTGAANVIDVADTKNFVSNYTYTAQGMPATASDPNGNTLTENWTLCGNLAVSKIFDSLLSLSYTSNCASSQITSITDANGEVWNSTYADPLDRITSRTTPMTSGSFTDTTTTAYTPTSVSTTMSFNSGNSVNSNLITLDGLGRPVLSQQAYSSSQYTTVQGTYNSVGILTNTSLPFLSAASTLGSNPTSSVTMTYDALGRPLTGRNANGNTVTYRYIGRDTLITNGSDVGQIELNGLGQIISYCQVNSLVGSGACGQDNAETGFLTTYSYNAGSQLLQISHNAQPSTAAPQNTTFTYDGFGRRLTAVRPESGTTTYTWDTDSTGTCSSSPGDIVRIVDANGNVVCRTFDLEHRLLSKTYPSGPNSAVTPAKHFVYDSSTTFTCPGAQNAKGKIAEVYTGTSTTKITDEGFCYSARGELTDVFETTPNSGGYFHTTATYWPDGSVNTLSGVPGITGSFTYTPGHAWMNSVAGPSSTNLVKSVTSTLGTKPSVVTYGSNDTDTYNLDSNQNFSGFSSTVGSSTVSNAWTWNANNTPSKQVISNPFDLTASGLTCTYGWDVLERMSSNNCINTSTSAAVYGQNFSYDMFGNVQKTRSSGYPAGQAWSPTYNLANNQYTGTPFAYDGNGQLTNDSLNTYTWRTDGKPASVTNIASGKTTTYTYDALDRLVEESVSGVSGHTQFVLSPMGKIATTKSVN